MTPQQEQPPRTDALREALDRAWLASNDAFGMARPADLGDHLVREFAALAATPSPSSATADPVAGEAAALERIRDAHTPDPDYPSGQGWDEKGNYVTKDRVCRVCGTSDEYAVEWPCWTYQQALAATPSPNSGLDVERLVRAFYNTPRKPHIEEPTAEHIARAAAEYARLQEQER